MGHSIQTHLAAYSRWCGDDVVDESLRVQRRHAHSCHVRPPPVQ
ncbi:MAG: hypothetical protein VKO00_06270 [Cyanobacteriota bacterium]|nr:hypothetical protein [Cyanobacteriota bacterium]